MTVGSRLGPYEIVAPLGIGGMGEVYRARDTKLNRDVAIKVLLSSVAHDADRLARFGREARLLAALNHPNIAHIHGLEESDGVPALVMELIEGPTLADRIAQGRIPFEEALPIVRQIAEALEAAHAQGIIHRDLKPSNIKVSAAGTVKVLDFGLAKALDPIEDSNSEIADSPTVSAQMTSSGVILGTAAYMSPEQARGKPVDTRADIWAFGCVLFEMLTARRAFRGDDVADLLVAVVTKEPDWQALPRAASGARSLIAWCLTKELRTRLQDVGDARIQIERLIAGRPIDSEPGSSPAQPRSRWPLAFGTVAVAGLIAAIVSSNLTAPAPVRGLPARFEIVSTPAPFLVSQAAERHIAISPDGRHIVYRAAAAAIGAGLAQLVVRPIDRLNGRSLAGITDPQEPFVSPDSQWIGFFDTASLRKVAIGGGPAVVICQTQGGARGAAWGEDGTIVFATTAGGIAKVSAGGGDQTVLTTPDAARGERNHWHPSLLPRGRGVLFTVISINAAEPPQVAVLDLKTGTQKKLITDGSQAQYVASGYLLYATRGTLRAVRFDLDRLELVGEPVEVVSDLSMSGGGAAEYAVSATGTLVYVSATRMQTPRSLVWVDRNGRESPIPAPPRLYSEPRLSPDGTRVVLTLREPEIDLWIWDFARDTLSRLTFDPDADQRPVWTLDGQRIVFASQRNGLFSLFEQAADGSGAAQRLTAAEDPQFPSSMSPDGAGVVGLQSSPKTSMDVVWFPLAGLASPSIPTALSKATAAEPLLQSAFSEVNAELSPDGRFLAYQSDESGRAEIYVRPFPRVNDGRWLVSTLGGTRPAWARNGRELFYLDPANLLTTVPVQTSGPKFSAGSPSAVFATKYAAPLNNSRTYDVSPDGQRFLMIKETAAIDATPTAGIIAVVNWFEELKTKLP